MMSDMKILNKKNLCYIAIPKNASTLVSNHLLSLQWQYIDWSNVKSDFTLFVIIRDPLERWISGFVEDIYTNLHNDFFSRNIIHEIETRDSWFLDWIFFSKTFHIGLHTGLQKDWINQFSHPQIIFFKLDASINYKLHHWLIGEGMSNDFLKLPKENVKHNLLMYNRITEYLFDAKNQRYKEKLLEYLKPDYELINSTKFL